MNSPVSVPDGTELFQKLSIVAEITVDRLRELVEADREDRCVVREDSDYEQTDDDKNLWECSMCGVEWVFESGTPFDNDIEFCPKCGSRIASISWHEVDTENDGSDGCTIIEITRTLTHAEAEAALAGKGAAHERD